MNNKLQQHLFGKAQELGWTVTEDRNGIVEFAKCSPAGEDFMCTVETENLIADILDYYEDFDPEQHAAGWIYRKYQSSVKDESIPDIRTLIDDAEAIEDMLWDLYKKLEEAKEDWEYENNVLP